MLSYPFMQHAFEAGTAVALCASVAGWFTVLRRQAFAGHTLAVMSFPGAGGAALAGLPPPVGYFAFCGTAAAAIAAGGNGGGQRRTSRESAAIGTVQAAALALGFLFLGLYGGVLENLEDLLFGSFLGVTGTQAWTLAGVAAGVLCFFALAGRPLLYATASGLAARAAGVPVGWLDAAFLVVLGAAVAATAQITGALLVFALLVAPPAAARELTARIPLGIALAALIALAVVWGSLALAYTSDRPVGVFVAGLAFGAYLACRAGRALRFRLAC